MSDASDIAAVAHATRLGWRRPVDCSESLGDAARRFLNSREGIAAASQAIRNGTSDEAFIDLPPGHLLKPFYDLLKDEK